MGTRAVSATPGGDAAAATLSPAGASMGLWGHIRCVFPVYIRFSSIYIHFSSIYPFFQYISVFPVYIHEFFIKGGRTTVAGFYLYLLSLLEGPEPEKFPGRIPPPGLDDLYIWKEAERRWEEPGRILLVGNIPDLIHVLCSQHGSAPPSPLLELFPPFSSRL